jgi:hypothetical protein
VSSRRLLAVALVAAVAGVLFDQIHVVGRVIAYRDPLLFGQPWWVPVQYGLAAAAGYLGGRLVHRFTAVTFERVWVATAWFLAAYLATAVFQRWPVVTALALVLVWLVRAVRLGLPVVLFSLAVATLGVLWETGLTSTGAFSYRHPNLLGVAYWLPALYLNAAPLLLAVTAPTEPPRPPRPPRSR